MKKLYLVKAEKYDYDQFDGAVVVASSKEEVLQIIGCYDDEGCGMFEADQGEISVEEIDLSQVGSAILLTSFNAG